MKNKDRWPAPYMLASRSNGTISVSGLTVGQAPGADGPVVCVKTNGGAIVVLAAPNAITGAAPAASANTRATPEGTGGQGA